MQTAAEVMDMLSPDYRGPAIERIGDSKFYAVRSWDLVAEATERVGDFSSNLTATMVVGAGGNISEFPVAELGSPVHALATADGDVHRVHRKLVLPSLTPRRLRSWKPFVDATLRELWDERYDGGIDWVTDIAERLPAAVIAELVGFDQKNKDRLLEWAFASTAMLDGIVTPSELDDSVVAVGELIGFLEDGLSRARSELPATVLGDLARLVNDGQIDQDVAVQVLIQLVAAGIESTVGHLGSLVWRLGRHPDQLDTLRSDDEARQQFIEESLRMETPFHGHFRHVVTDTELGGTRLAAGTHLFLLWGSANRDCEHFDQPDEFRPARDDGSHLTFGRGIHFCVGAALARLESRSALDFLLSHESTPRIDTATSQWRPSLLVRRLQSLRISV